MPGTIVPGARPSGLNPPTTRVFRGLNIYGSWSSSGADANAFPTAADFDYYKSRGFDVFRWAIAGDLLQTTLFGSFDATYAGKIDSAFALARTRGQKIFLTHVGHGVWPWNAATSATTQIGGSTVTAAAYADFWTKVAQRWVGESAFYGYDLNNEPYNAIGWDSVQQTVVNAIRAVDVNRPIICCPLNETSWAATTSAPSDLPDGDYARGWNGAPVDPYKNLMYQIHVYGDPDGSGVYTATYDTAATYATIMQRRASQIVTWADARGIPHSRLIIGEYGVPSTDARYYSPAGCLGQLLSWMDQVGVNGTYWASGVYGDANQCYPTGGTTSGTDKPQMGTLVAHLRFDR